MALHFACARRMKNSTYPKMPLIRFMLSILSMCFVYTSAEAQQFIDRAEDAGLQNAFNGHGMSVADYDLDGDLDLYVVSYREYDIGDPRTWNHLYKNNGDGTFTDVTNESGTRVETIDALPVRSMGNKMGASWGDYDNDGDPDLILTNVGPEVLFKNLGDGTFIDVAEEVGIRIDAAEIDTVETATPLWWDYDLDGDLDLYISSWNRENRFYANNGDGTFANITATTGMSEPDRSLMALPSDYNQDGLPDLYVINDFTVNENGTPQPGVNHLYLANGDGTFRDATVEYGLEMPGNGMGATLGDFNNDGYFEIFLTNISTLPNQPNPLYQGGPTPPFPNIGSDLGVGFTDWGWGTEFFDADHDGDIDLFVVNGFFPFENNTPNYYFENTLFPLGTAGFVEKATEEGLDGFLRFIGTQKIYPDGHGVVIFDYDEDGDLDIAVGNWGGSTVPVFLYENTRRIGNWLKVKLEGVQSNRDGFGSVLEIQTAKGTQVRSYDGADYMGQSVQPVHFGLGGDQVVERLKVSWPNGYSEEFYDISTNQTIQISEGSGIAVSSELQLEPSSALSINLFPNPAVSEISVRVEHQQPSYYTILVTDVLGRTLSSQTRFLSASQTVRISDLSNMATGLYFISVRSQNGTLNRTKSFFVQPF